MPTSIGKPLLLPVRGKFPGPGVVVGVGPPSGPTGDDVTVPPGSVDVVDGPVNAVVAGGRVVVEP
jgi:hypothetical protein